MRNTLKFFIIILFIVSLFIPLSGFGSDISAQFKASLNEIPHELASPIAKAGLESIVFQFYRARVEFAPNSYEPSNDFVSTFEKSFDAFRVLLYSVDLSAVKEKVSTDYISKMEKSYSKHEKNFTEFSNALVGKVNFFKNIHPSAILKSQMYFSFILSGFNKGEWLSSRKFTHIWPFCD